MSKSKVLDLEGLAFEEAKLLQVVHGLLSMVGMKERV